MAQPAANIDQDGPVELNLDNLFPVSRVEVVQQISSEELKAVIQQLAQSIAALSQGPKSEDLQKSISSLKEELLDLKDTHSTSLHQLTIQQEQLKDVLDKLATSEEERKEAVQALKASQRSSLLRATSQGFILPHRTEDGLQQPGAALERLPLTVVLDAVDNLVDERLAFTIATDAPVSQAKMVASIASVEGQIKALARSNAELHQQLQDSKLDIQVMPGEAENDLAKENEKIAEDEDAKLDKEQESLPETLQENIAGPASEETSLPKTIITSVATGVSSEIANRDNNEPNASTETAAEPEAVAAELSAEALIPEVKWQRTSDLIVAQSANAIVLEKLEQLTAKVDQLTQSKAELLDILQLQNSTAQLHEECNTLRRTQQAQGVALRADREIVTDLQLSRAMRNSSLASSKSRHSFSNPSTKGSIEDGANTLLGQVKALVDAKADKAEVSALDEALRSQQSTIHQQTSFTQKGLQHLNSKVLASQLGEGVDQEAAASELSSLQESIHIIAHVAHAVAVNQLDTPQAHIQIPSPLTLSSSQSSSERRVFGVATAASAPLLPEPMAAAQETIGRGDNEATVQLVDSPSMRGSFMGLPDAKPTISTGAVNISSETLDDLSEGSNKNKASDLISPEIAHPSFYTISGGLGQSIPPTAANSIKALTLVPSQAIPEVARPTDLGPASEETPATRAESPASRMNPIAAPEVDRVADSKFMKPALTQQEVLAALQELLQSGALHQPASGLQVASKESSVQQSSRDFAEYEQILADIQQIVRLLQDKLVEHEHKQVVMAQEYGMLVRKPYFGYSCMACDTALPMQEHMSKASHSFDSSLAAALLPAGQLGPQLPKGGWRAVAKNPSSLSADARGVSLTSQRPATAKGRLANR